MNTTTELETANVHRFTKTNINQGMQDVGRAFIERLPKHIESEYMGVESLKNKKETLYFRK
jgi:hypothetical protein